jgi:UDP-N-acetylglucosamine 2-epimerase (non-hydrolysing)
VVTIVGTRPEVIRLSRTIARLDATFDHLLVHTGQNYDYELNGVFFDELDLRPPDHYLAVDTSSLGRFLGGTLVAIEQMLLELRPDAVLVLGDTNSCISAVMAKRLQVPVYHMEAGNRCFDPNVPEEVNRSLVDHVADFNLVYTEAARRNLLAEGLPTQRITLTGSPMAEVLAHYGAAIRLSRVLADLELDAGGYVLVSAHREENIDEPARFELLVRTLEVLRDELDRPILVSTHPRTRQRLEAFGVEALNGVTFHKPFGFLDYAQLQQHAYCVLSDSGTVAEESSILGFPAVTLRDAIERPEALETGAIVTAGLEPAVVIDAVRQVVAQWEAGEVPATPAEYQILDCSQRVVNFIRSTAHGYHDRVGIRRRSPLWRNQPESTGAS